MPAGERPEGVADPAEDDGGEHRQQQGEAEFGFRLPSEATTRTPAKPASPPDEDPGVEDDAPGVDPGRLGEVEVVGERAHLLAERA